MESMMPLSMVSPGESVEIVAVNGGFGLQKRLADMGLTPGVRVKMISSQGRGPVVIDVRGSRLALGHGVSHRIMVS